MRYCHYVVQIAALLLEVVPGLAQGAWSNWGSWSACSVSCGYGIIKREKVWVFDGRNQNPQNTFRYEDIMECYTDVPCPVDGMWSYWNAWSECSAMCDGGKMARTRNCNSPEPKDGGKPCNGSNVMDIDCNTWVCPELPPDFNISACNETTFMCKSRLQCIPASHVCDQSLQCHDGSDEHDCSYYYDISGAKQSPATLPAILYTVAIVIFAALSS